MKKENGFSLIEVLVTISLVSILLTLSAGGVRHYWFVQSLDGAQGELVSQLRQMQEQVVSETHPTVFGVRFRVGSSDWAIVEYDPTATPTPTCTDVRTNKFGSGVQVTSATFTPPADTAMHTKCKAIPGASSDSFAFFYARGSATGGSVTIVQPQLGRTKTVTVTPITGRVEAL